MMLTGFLLARIAEDEAFASLGIRLRESVGAAGLTARQQGHLGGLFDLVLDDPEAVAVVQGYSASGLRAPGEAERILTECEAKRRIVALHSEYTDHGDSGACGMCGDVPQIDWPCDTIKALALPYADHPDFDESWRVTG